jgi:ATPase subunit of ABC transporter with duplicated ATPase domains
VGASWAKVSTLSGGERSRLLFVGLTLARYSLLMLDEPTNHLDMEGKEALAHPATVRRRRAAGQP